MYIESVTILEYYSFAVRSVSLLFHFSRFSVIEAPIPSYECIRVVCHFISSSEVDFVGLDCCVWPHVRLSKRSFARFIIHVECWIQIHLQSETNPLIRVQLVYACLH